MRTIYQLREAYRALPEGGTMRMTVSELRLVEDNGLEPDTGPRFWRIEDEPPKPFKKFRIVNDPPEDITKETLSGN